MSLNRYYYYDHDSCSFVEVSVPWWKRYRKPAFVGAGLVSLVALVVWVSGLFSEAPHGDASLVAENKALQEQLRNVQSRIKALDKRVDNLSVNDKKLYRTILEAEPISEDVRKVGVGGVDSYRKFARYGAATALLLRETASDLDQIERKIALQNNSYRELARLAEERKHWLAELPVLIPADGPLVSGFGMRRHPILRVTRMHKGIDVLVDVGSTVVAAGDGTVKETGHNATFGKHILIQHPSTGYSTMYAHLSQIGRDITPGRKVKRGDRIGLSGNTGLSSGPHLHFEVRDGKDEAVNPIYFLAPNMTPGRYRALLKASGESGTSLD